MACHPRKADKCNIHENYKNYRIKPSEIEISPTLKGASLKKCILKKFEKNKEKMIHSMRNRDYDQNGKISLIAFRDILQKYCFPLTEAQWNEVVDDLKPCRGKINYGLFIACYEKTTLDETYRLLKFFPKRRLVLPVPYREFINSVKDRVRIRRPAIRQALQKFDSSGRGCITREDFYKVVNMYIDQMDLSQFEQLLCEVSMTPTGRVKYIDFLQEFGGMNPMTCSDYVECVPTPGSLLSQDPPLNTLADCPARIYTTKFTYKKLTNCRDVLCGCREECPQNYFAPGMCPERKPPCAYDNCYRVHRNQPY